MIEVFKSMIQKKAQEFYNLRRSITSCSKKRLKRNLTFNQGTRKIFGALRSLGERFWKFVGTSGKILATPLKNRACSLTPPPSRGGSAPRSNPLPFYITYLTEKRTLSYTFH